MSKTGLDHIDEHPDFFVFNKPAGLACHGPAQDNLAMRLQSAGIKPLLCHRLDRECSGLIVVAKTPQVADNFRLLFEQDAINKIYLALGHRKGKKKQGSIKGHMEKARKGSWKLSRTGEINAITDFISLGLDIPEQQQRLFVLKIHGGKTHQIRVAMKANGSPIIGDNRYGGVAAERLMLHASALSFDWQGQRLAFHSQAPFVGEDWLTRYPQLSTPESFFDSQ